MFSATAEDVKPISELADDDFLTVFDTSLKLLKKNVEKKKPSMYHTVEAKKGDIMTCSSTLCSVLESLIQEGTTKEELESTFTSFGLQQNRINLLVSQLDQLKEAVAKRKLSRDAREEVIDLQWKFGVVAGSSVKEETGRTFVQVKLVVRSSSGVTSSRHLEMSLEKFYDFLHQLEKAKASLDYVNYL